MWRARLSHLVKGLSFKYDHHAAHSQGARIYVQKYLPLLHTLNPSLPVYDGKEIQYNEDDGSPIDDSNGVFKDVPHVTVTYDYNQVKSLSIANMDVDQIDATLKELALQGLTNTTPPVCNTIDIIHAYNPPRPPYRPIIGPGWQYSDSM